MRVQLVLRLVLHKEHGVHRLAHIVEERTDARQQRIRADKLSRLLGQIGHLQAVLVRAGCVAQAF